MKRTYIFPLFLALVTFIACDKVPANGDLDGMWQLLSIQTPDSIRDMKDKGVYTSFQLNLIQWKAKRTFFSHFTHTADSIIIYDISYSASNDDYNNYLVTPKDMDNGVFDSFGIHSINPRFRIMKLNSSVLELQQADTTLRYRKF